MGRKKKPFFPRSNNVIANSAQAEKVICEICLRKDDIARQLASGQTTRCKGCDNFQPTTVFEEDRLSEQVDGKDLCFRCVAVSAKDERMEKKCKCNKYEKSKPWTQYSPLVLKKNVFQRGSGEQHAPTKVVCEGC